MCTSEINGANVDSRQRDETKEKLKHVHIGVFFDGTNNNMVQKFIYSGIYFNHKIENSEEEDVAEDIKEARKRIYDLQKELEAKNYEYYSLLKSLYPSSFVRLNELEEDIRSIEENIDKESALFEVSEKDQWDYSKKKEEEEEQEGLTNVSILYSLFNWKFLEEQEENPAKAIKFYIEGSGATDISATTKFNVNGLGFGLGDTGVTALVSKGVRLVTNYINSLKTEIDENTKVHFYLFGFSRGATCARLFTHIATRKRDSGEVLKVREKEFTDFIPNLVNESGRVKFLEDTDLNWKNITVDILGIYDTVVSIGFLRQKDGWVDPARAIYKYFPNYIENWHYKNVTQYGLYLCPNKEKLKYVVHIGALDEFRENFAFTNIGAEVPDNAVEILIPGCHADVGGGEMDGDEQEISLPFYTEKEGKRVNTKILLHRYDKKPTESYPSAQEGTKAVSEIIKYKINMDKFDSAPLMEKSLEYIGWTADWDVEKDKCKEKRDTISLEEHHSSRFAESLGLNFNYFNKIYFKRRVKRGWSDVALKIMIDKVNTLLTNGKGRLLKNDLFRSPYVYNYNETLSSDRTVLKIARDIVSKCSEAKLKNRYLMIPGGDISSELYKHLRLHYLHFTSTNSPGHKGSKEADTFEGKAANVGNKPNFDLQGNLCRITYHGNKVAELMENLPDDGYRTHVHYMYDLKFSQILVING